MSELIDRERFSADMRDFQNRVGIWRDEAEDTETRTRADAALATIIETKLILDKQPTVAASPWHRVEEELPSMDGYDWVLGIVTGEAGYLLFHKAVMMVSFDPEYKEWFIDEYPDARITVSHWMLLPEPPKEEE